MAERLSAVSRALLTVGSAAVAAADPRRADMVALLGDLTSAAALQRLVRRVERSGDGRRMLRELRPARFPARGSASLRELRALRDGSLGREYARFMDARAFAPEGRAAVRFVRDARQRWVLQRYRDVHDLWHVLTALPTTLLGETAQKLFEAAHTGLPVAALGAAAGAARLRAPDRARLARLAPWALGCGAGCADLLAVPYERHLHRNVHELRRLWRLTAAPPHHLK